MIRRPPRSTQSRSSAASDVYKRQAWRGSTNAVRRRRSASDQIRSGPTLPTEKPEEPKVQTLDGRWLSIDGRVLYKATVAASETYNTSLERHLADKLGLRFEERPNPGARKRPVREIVGVDPALSQRWSARRASIETRRTELAADFQRTHGRPP